MKEQRIREELAQCRELTSELFMGGVSGVPDGLLRQIKEEAAFTGQFGMEWLSNHLEELAELLEKRRHEISGGQDSEICSLLCRIVIYLEEGIWLSSMDEAGIRICQRTWEEST